MLDYIQILVALGSILLEFESFRNARRLFEAEDRKAEWAKILQSYRITGVLLLSLAALGYAVCSVVWAFSPSLPIRVAGITLAGMTGLGFLMRRLSLERIWLKPMVVRIDSVISIGCLLTVIFMKGVFA
jgi:hypothetical protein